jgi:hypothetical protein
MIVSFSGEPYNLPASVKTITDEILFWKNRIDPAPAPLNVYTSVISVACQ